MFVWHWHPRHWHLIYVATMTVFGHQSDGWKIDEQIQQLSVVHAAIFSIFCWDVPSETCRQMVFPVLVCHAEVSVASVKCGSTRRWRVTKVWLSFLYIGLGKIRGIFETGNHRFLAMFLAMKIMGVSGSNVPLVQWVSAGYKRNEWVLRPEEQWNWFCWENLFSGNHLDFPIQQIKEFPAKLSHEPIQWE